MNDRVKPGPAKGSGGRPKRADGKTKDRARKDRNIAQRDKDIAVLDFETDPFDEKKGTRVKPFLAVLMSYEFGHVEIWDEDEESFISKVLVAIEELPRKFTIYAHNGGKFDFMFLLHRLRGRVMFKGRGIMAATVGNHTLRDSMHIVPGALANYKKDDFDYKKLYKHRRNKHREEIIRYCVNDCRYLLDLVTRFIARFGRKISIGAAATNELTKLSGPVAKFSEQFDAYIRNFYFGGRVECLGGIGRFSGDYVLYDVNSMYPAAMRNYKHPVGGPKCFTIHKGAINENTCFIDLTCLNYGGLVCRTEDGATNAPFVAGRFWTTIFEYQAAIELGLISDVTLNLCIDCSERTDFAAFVDEHYSRRLLTKENLRDMSLKGLENTDEYMKEKTEDIFAKLLLNNAYGKQAQNPRRYRECYITDVNKRPEEEVESWGALPHVECDRYWIWDRPNQKQRYNNVAMAASITGAARAMLMRGIGGAVDPVYCDTDSIICRSIAGVDLHKSRLGAWDAEDQISELIVVGKKFYAYKRPDGTFKRRLKGAEAPSWKEYEKILAGEMLSITATGPTMDKRGGYKHITRRLATTGTIGISPIVEKLRKAA